MTLLAVSLVLAALLGFSAHRASICTVWAVAEVLSTRRAYMFLSFAKTFLWIIAITVPLVWLLPTARVSSQGWALSATAMLGGVLFGVGAAVNGGCAFSTLTRLADGQVRMVLSLAGFCLGAAAYVSLVTASLVPPGVPAPSAYDASKPWALVLAAGLWAWIVWEAARLWRTRPSGSTLSALVLSSRYRLSTAAALLGVSNGILYALHGSWAYTGTLGRATERAVGTGPGPSALHLAFFAFLLAGMALSAWEKGSFRLDWRPSRSWARNLVGGLLMGLGAAMVPGGNDALVLHAIPALSPHAVPAYGAMIAGIAAVLIMMRLVRGASMTVDCGGDICVSKA